MPEVKSNILDFLTGPEGEILTMKLKAGKYLVTCNMWLEDGRIFFKHPFNKPLMAEIKELGGRKYHGYDKPTPRKIWSAPVNERNIFSLRRMAKENPYAIYDAPIKVIPSNRELYEHQTELFLHGMSRRYCIIAAEMGSGKSLVAIEMAESCNPKPNEIWYVGPVAGVKAFNREIRKWKCKVIFKMMTYNAMTTLIKKWTPGQPAPLGVILDECSKVKTSTSQRSQQALFLATAVREEHGNKGFLMMMSGTPAPKTPADWWMQCLTKDALISTTEGLQYVGDLIGKSFTATFNGYKIPCEEGFFKTGENREIVTINTKEGYSLDCTPDHKILCDFDGLQYWVEAGKLEKDDKICLDDAGETELIRTDSESDGYILGHIYGDGSIQDRDGKLYGIVSVYKGDETVKDYFVREHKGSAQFSQPNGESEREDWYCKYNHGLVRKYECTPEKLITPKMLAESKGFLKGFVAGMFDTDGSVEVSRLRIQITQVCKQKITMLQQILNHLGIKSLLCGKKVGLSKIGDRVINNQDGYTLSISGNAARQFNRSINLRHRAKANRLSIACMNTERRETKMVATVTTVTDAGIADEVYDCTITKHHRFAANGMIVHNCEIACPGFLREGSPNSFKARLCHIEQIANGDGATFPKIRNWWDNVKRCKKCGEFSDHPNHSGGLTFQHKHEASVNEVENLSKRLQGLVVIKFKKDCLDLPDKQYETIQIPPTASVLRAAKLIKARSTRAITALTLLRELSDGFQYSDENDGDLQSECNACSGTKVMQIPLYDYEDDSLYENKSLEVTYEEVECTNCKGKGTVQKMKRVTVDAESPKDKVFTEYLDEYSEVGRFVVWGGFTGTLDRLVQLAHQEGWTTLRVDGKGYKGFDCQGNPINSDLLLDCMDRSEPGYNDLRRLHPKVCFVGHPQAGGMALTLTSSPISLYYSNPFDGEARMQSEDRIHRAGMDANAGALIVDLIHLPTDLVVLNNLKNKKRLQNMSMGQLTDAWANMEGDRNE